MAQAKRKQPSKEEKGSKYILTKLLIGSVVGITVFFALLCLAALVILKNPVESNLMVAAALLISALSAITAGFVAVRPIRKNGILMGVCAVLPLIVAVGLALLFESGGSIGLMSAVMAAIMLLSGAAGGVLAVNIKKRMK